MKAISQRPLAGAILAVVCCAIVAINGCKGEAETNQVSFLGPFKNDKSIKVPFERLPAHVTPTAYHIDLNFVHSIKNMNYEGTVKIDVAFDESALENLDEKSGCLSGIFCTSKREFIKKRIVLHADRSVEIEGVNVAAIDEYNESTNLIIVNTGRDKEKDFIVIETKRDLPLDMKRGTITLNFKAPIRQDGAFHGVYLSKNWYNDRAYQFIVAKFQPVFARLALPCFDEPGFKAKFNLKIRHNAATDENLPMSAYSTMRAQVEDHTDGYKLASFPETPKMSIHMFSFVVGSFDEQTREKTVRDGELTLRFLGVPGTRDASEFALKVAEEAILYFENYIDYKFPLEKLDIFAIGDTDTDNTETWGLVYVRHRLATIDGDSLRASRISTAVNVAHVVVHQWFANLVTGSWWDQLWITESVAAQKAFELVAKLYPDLHSEYPIRIGFLSGILTQDETGQMHSISPPKNELTTPTQIYKIFDNLTFTKSGAVARMIQNLIGEKKFQQALQLVVKYFHHGSIDLDGFMACVKEVAGEEKANLVTIEEIIRTYSKQTSYPLVSVDYEGQKDDPESKLAVYMEPIYKSSPLVSVTRFEANNKRRNPWCLPMDVLMAKGKQRTKTESIEFTSDQSIVRLNLPDWYNENDGFVKLQPKPDFSTYYRIRYSDTLTRQLQDAIKEQQLDAMNRLHILNDLRNLARLQLIKSDVFYDFFNAYENEEDYAVMLEMLKAEKLLSVRYTPLIGAKVFRRVLDEQKFDVTGNESPLEEQARSAILKMFVAKRDPDAIKMALEVYAKFEADRDKKVAVFLREPVYLAVALKGTKQQQNQLLEKLTNSRNHEERLRLASTLAFSNKDVLRRLVAILNQPNDFNSEELKQIASAESNLVLINGMVMAKVK
uniref:Puromycin-sensitive aminopeptidase n=1 Tax=Aceria tosichella TaxID=561515 RepID=A0A6G1SFC7_9ACAR